MKSQVLFIGALALLLVLLVSGCGGGSGVTPPPPPPMGQIEFTYVPPVGTDAKIEGAVSGVSVIADDIAWYYQAAGGWWGPYGVGMAGVDTFISVYPVEADSVAFVGYLTMSDVAPAVGGGALPPALSQYATTGVVVRPSP